MLPLFHGYLTDHASPTVLEYHLPGYCFQGGSAGVGVWPWPSVVECCVALYLLGHGITL